MSRQTYALRACRGFLFALGLSLILWQCRPAGITPDPVRPTRDDNLMLGSSSRAGGTDANNYLLDKATYVLGYNASRDGPNWVSWHLSKAWKGLPPPLQR